MVGCLQVVRIYSSVYIRASYIVFLNVKTENNNFIKEIKHVLGKAKFENYRAGETLDCALVFH